MLARDSLEILPLWSGESFSLCPIPLAIDLSLLPSVTRLLHIRNEIGFVTPYEESSRLKHLDLQMA